MAGWAGSERYLADITRGLLRRGHDVTVACAPGTLFEQRCREYGFPHIHLKMRRFGDWPQVPRFVVAYASGRYQVVHTHHGKDLLVPAFAARIARVPAVVMTKHLPNPYRARWRAYTASVLYDRIIAVSHFVASVLRGSGMPDDRIAVVYNGIDAPAQPAGAQSLREELGIPAGALLAAAAGRVETVKGFDVLAKAIARLHREGLPLYAVIFGEGTEREPLAALIRQLGMSPFIRLPGFRADVEKLWHAADVTVVPSATPDSFPYSVLEALAAGKPVVASRIGGIPEMLTDECGILVAPGDPEDLAAALRTVFCSKDRAAMGRAALARSGEFTLDKTVAGVEQVYRSILETGPHAPVSAEGR
jgi:glycosyltransferase involved in cell wall biosynthesis